MSLYDQFFTRPEVAALCWKYATAIVPALTGKSPQELAFIEPAAGYGAFYELLPVSRRLGLDIQPRHPRVIEHDFLTFAHPTAPSETVIIGNPPFGKRGRMALKFFHRAASLADTIAFILPPIFRKYSIHKRLPCGWRWIGEMSLPEKAFWIENPVRSYDVRAVFQLWTRLPSSHPDRRLFSPPPTSHSISRCFNTTIRNPP